MSRGLLDPEEIDALILVTQSPDYFIPPTANVIQGALGLKEETLCMDINQGCCGYLLGLMQACMLLEMDEVRKVVLLNGEVLSRKMSKKDWNSYPLVGDAASVTVVERAPEKNEICFNLRMDGTRSKALYIPAGGLRHPCTPETAVLKDGGDGNLRSLDHLVMDGAEVFAFVQKEVPPMIEETLRYAGTTEADIDYYLFHQPNRFMLKKLAERMGIDPRKMPMNIVEEYGNSSGCTIPVNAVHNLGERLKQQELRCCLAGFGSGLSWSCMILTLGKLAFAESIQAPC